MKFNKMIQSIVTKHIESDFGSEDHYEPYFDRWEEAPFHMPEDSEYYDFVPEGVPTKVGDIGDFALETVRKWKNV